MNGNGQGKDEHSKQQRTYEEFLLKHPKANGEDSLVQDCIVLEARASRAFKLSLLHLVLGLLVFIVGALTLYLHPAASISSAALRSPIFLLSSFLLHCSWRYWKESSGLNNAAFQASRTRTAYLIFKENVQNSELLGFAEKLM